QAHTEERSFPGKVPDQFDTDAGFMRSTRSGRHNDALRTHRLHLSYRDLIISPDLNLLAQFTDILDKVVGEGIVVVENENQAAKLLALRLHQNTEASANPGQFRSPLNVLPPYPSVVLTLTPAEAH